MPPSLSTPTDNIYKFACLFGLVLIVSGVFSFVSVYNTSLEAKLKYAEAQIALEAKPQRDKAEESMLALSVKMIEVTKANEKTAYRWIGVVVVAGLLLSAFGAGRWYLVVQARDDRMADLQIRKLTAEVARLEAGARDANDEG